MDQVLFIYLPMLAVVLLRISRGQRKQRVKAPTGYLAPV